jgi:predicted chitinase
LEELAELSFEISRVNPTVTAGDNAISEWIESLWENKLAAATGGLAEVFNGFAVPTSVNGSGGTEFGTSPAYIAREQMKRALDYMGRLTQATKLVDHPDSVEQMKLANSISHLLNLGGAYAALNPTVSSGDQGLYLETIWNSSNLEKGATELENNLRGLKTLALSSHNFKVMTGILKNAKQSTELGLSELSVNALTDLVKEYTISYTLTNPPAPVISPPIQIEAPQLPQLDSVATMSFLKLLQTEYTKSIPSLYAQLVREEDFKAVMQLGLNYLDALKKNSNKNPLLEMTDKSGSARKLVSDNTSAGVPLGSLVNYRAILMDPMDIYIEAQFPGKHSVQFLEEKIQNILKASASALSGISILNWSGSRAGIYQEMLNALPRGPVSNSSLFGDSPLSKSTKSTETLKQLNNLFNMNLSEVTIVTATALRLLTFTDLIAAVPDAAIDDISSMRKYAAESIPLLFLEMQRQGVIDAAHQAYILGSVKGESMFGANMIEDLGNKLTMGQGEIFQRNNPSPTPKDNTGKFTNEFIGLGYEAEYIDAESAYGKRSDLGNDLEGDGFKYRGMGYIQLTGKRNYTLLNVTPTAPQNSRSILNPEIAAWVTVKGMKEGIFAGVTLSDYIPVNIFSANDLFIPGDSSKPFTKARYIVNGGEYEDAYLRGKEDARIRVEKIAQDSLNFWKIIS